MKTLKNRRFEPKDLSDERCPITQHRLSVDGAWCPEHGYRCKEFAEFVALQADIDDGLVGQDEYLKWKESDGPDVFQAFIRYLHGEHLVRVSSGDRIVTNWLSTYYGDDYTDVNILVGGVKIDEITEIRTDVPTPQDWAERAADIKAKQAQPTQADTETDEREPVSMPEIPAEIGRWVIDIGQDIRGRKTVEVALTNARDDQVVDSCYFTLNNETDYTDPAQARVLQLYAHAYAKELVKTSPKIQALLNTKNADRQMAIAKDVLSAMPGVAHVEL